MNILIEMNDGNPGYVKVTAEREPGDRESNEAFLKIAVDRLLDVLNKHTVSLTLPNGQSLNRNRLIDGGQSCAA